MKLDILITDTREGEIGVVRAVPAESIEEAAQKVAKKKGYHWVGTPKKRGMPGSFFVIDRDYFASFEEKKYSSDELDALIAEASKRVLVGGEFEFRGLLELSQYTLSEEEFEE